MKKFGCKLALAILSLNLLSGIPMVANATEFNADFTWNDSVDKWEHGTITDSKTAIFGDYKVGIYSQEDGVIKIGVGESKYTNDYMASFAELRFSGELKKTYTVDLSELFPTIKDTIKVTIDFSGKVPEIVQPENPNTGEKIENPKDVYFNDFGSAVFATVGKNTTTKVYDSAGNRIDDGSMYSQNGGKVQLDFWGQLTSGTKIYVVSEDADTGVLSEKVWITYTDENAQKEQFTVTVNYLDKNNNEISPTKYVYGIYEDSNYTEKAINIANYTLSNQSSQTIKVNNDNKTINFIYDYTPVQKTKVTIKYVDEKGNSLSKDKVVSDLVVGNSYSEKSINIPNYILTNASEQKLNLLKDNNVIKFVYKAKPVEKANVTVKYVDEKGASIASNKVIKSKDVNSKVTEKAISVNGYTLNGANSQTVTVSKSGSTMTFKYKKNTKANVTVKYVDEKGTTIASNKVVKNKNVNSKVTEKAISVNGYTLNGAKSQTVTVNHKGNTMTFKYKKNTKANVTVKYVDEKGKSIKSNKVLKNKNVNSKVTEKSVGISGYSLNSSNKQTVTVNHKGNTITFKYKKNTKANITIKYVDNKGRTISPNKTIKNVKVGSGYTEKSKKIRGYKLTSKSSQKVTVSHKGNTITFKYKK